MPDRTAKAEILIRRPVAKVFSAFVDPGKITRFWLESTTGPLAEGARLAWRFMVPGATETVTVTAFEDQRRISFDWSDGISVTINFEEYVSSSAMRVAIEVVGFQSEHAKGAIVDATEGFSIVLCDLKTLLETGRSANLVRDKAELIALVRQEKSSP